MIALRHASELGLGTAVRFTGFQMLNPLPLEVVTACGQTNVAAIFAVAEQFWSGLEQMSSLNLQALRSVMSVTPSDFSQMSSMEEAQHRLAWYQSHLTEIGSAFGTRCAKIADEHGLSERQRAQTLLDTLEKNAPPGSKAFVGVLLAPVAAAGSSYEAVRRTALSEMAEFADRACHAVQVATAAGRASVTAATICAARTQQSRMANARVVRPD